MKRKIICVLSIFLVLACVGVAIVTTTNSQNANAEIVSEQVNAKTYEFDEGNNYNFSSGGEVSSMTFGRKTLGSLTISGEITDITTFRNRTAYGVNGNLSFSYNYDGSLQSNTKENWNLISDTGVTVNDVTLSGSINKGALIVQDSSDGSSWNNTVNPIVNYFGDNKNGSQNFYTTDGSKIALGWYYRVVVAYETGRKIGETGWWLWKEDVYEYKKHVEVYEFYVCINSGVISIHNSAVTDDSFENEEYSLEELKKGETLLDNSVTSKGFSIDKLGTSYLVSVSRNGGVAEYVNDGAEFTENGKYEITTITKLGKNIKQTVYIFNTYDNGYSAFFGDGFVAGKRVFRDGNYPTYARGTYLHINQLASGVPPISGVITDLYSGEVVDEIQSSYSRETRLDLQAGSYKVELYCGNMEAGSVFHYTFIFNVLDEVSAPYVNYTNFMSGSRLLDMVAKHYEVAYQTTLGGYIFVCFSLDSYNVALNYAYEIEKRFIELAPDGQYYKSKDNPNLKIKYTNQIDLTSALYYYAEKNIEINYFNPQDEFTYRTYNNDLLSSLESLNMRESIKVFPSQEERNKLLDVKFVNDFEFIRVADYDVVDVVAYCHKTGQTYHIDFNRNVSEQLSITSKYTITETNKYGDAKVYDVYYVHQNETQSVWNVTYDGTTTSRTVSVTDIVNGQVEITADSVVLKNVVNSWDASTIATIKAPNVYSFEIKGLASELNGLGLYKKGNYEITFIDRTGHSYKVMVTLTGNGTYSDVMGKGARSYSTVYNALHLNKIDESEDMPDEYIELLQELKDELDLFEKASAGMYTTESYNIWKEAYEQGKAIYQSSSATQTSIFEALLRLKNARRNLVVRDDKGLLYNLILTAESVDCLRYTPASIERLAFAYQLARKVYADSNVTLEQIEYAEQLLDEYLHELVEMANFDQLLSLIKQVRTIDILSYSVDSVENLRLVYNDAVVVCNNRNNPQSVVNDSYFALSRAFSNLVISGDATELRSTINIVAQTMNVLYTTQSIEALQQAYDLALDGIAKRVSQAQLDVLNLNLQLKLDALELRQDKKALYDFVTELTSANFDNLTGKQFERLQEVYARAIEVLNSLDATEEEVNSILAELQEVASVTESFATWKIILICVILGVLLIISCITVVACGESEWFSWLIAFLVVAVTVTLTVLLFVYTQLGWWILLITGGVIVAGTVAGVIVGKIFY